MGHNMQDYLMQHNTVIGMNGSQPWVSFFFNQGKCSTLYDQPTNIWILDNVLSKQPSGDCGYQGQNALDKYIPLPGPDGFRFSGNVMYVPGGDRGQTWPVHNYWTDTSDGNLARVEKVSAGPQSK